MNPDIPTEEAILTVARTMAARDRTAFLEKACGENAALRQRVEQRLSEDRGFAGLREFTGFNDSAPDPTVMTRPQEGASDMIDRYKLLQEIGSGGFGTVWMAEQETPVRRRVALKIIKLGMDTREVVARFEAERQALAMMDHPNIAKVLDAGATPAGRPYFVLELVRGAPITQYCDDHKLPMAQRLDLFVQVCSAIQHAHQKGVIHRDLKPSNILVASQDGRPVPKVIDFGIAKATQQRLTEKTLFTRFDQMVGTPVYMSPEQAAGNLDIDTRSDIYTLGVLLYELTTGRTPFDARELMRRGFDEIRRVIREEEPRRPSTAVSTLAAPVQTDVARRRDTEPPKLIGLLRGDLDWIVMKALEKDRARRYDTANGLALDIQRHLASEPVTACPPSALYRLRKLVRRNRLAFIAGTAVALALIVGLAASSWMFVREKKQRQRAVAAEREQSLLRARAEEARGTETRLRAEAEASEREQHRLRLEAEKAGKLARDRLQQSARSDWAFARKLLTRTAEPRPSAARGTESRQERARDAFAYLARSCENDPGLVAVVETTLAELHNWTFLPRLATLEGHRDQVTAAVFSPDGSRIITASDDRTARIWDLSSGRTLATLAGHQDRVTSAAFSPDGAQAVTTSWDKTVRVWEVASGRELAAHTGHSSRVHGALFSADGRRIVTSSLESDANYLARIWSTADGSLLRAFRNLDWRPGSADLSSDGSRILTKSQTLSAVRVLDVASGQTLATAEGPGARGICAALSPDGTRFLTASGETSAQVWDVAGGKLVATLAGSEYPPRAAAFSADGSRVLTASMGEVRVWDATGGRLLKAMKLPDPMQVAPGTRPGQMIFLSTSIDTDPLRAAGQLSPDGSRMVAPCRDHTTRVSWNGNSALRSLLRRGRGGANRARFSRDGSRVLAISREGPEAWDVATGARLSKLPQGKVSGTAAASFSPDGTRVVAIATEGQAAVWDVAGSTILARLDAPGAKLNRVAFSLEGGRILTAAESGPVRVWDAASATLLATLDQHGDKRTSVSFSPDGARIVTTSKDKAARIWEATTGRLLVSIQGRADVFADAGFSPDGGRIATTSPDRSVQVWDSRDGRLLATIGGPRSPAERPAFSPDGRRLVSLSPDQTAHVWDAATGRRLAVLRGHERSLNCAEFSPDGSRIVTGSMDYTIRIWDSAQGTPLCTHHLSDVVRDVQYSPDGNRILVTFLLGDFHILEAPGIFERCPSWWPLLLKILGERLLDENGELADLSTGQIQGILAELQRAIAADRSRLADIARWFLARPEEQPVRPGETRRAFELADDLISPDAPGTDLLRAHDLNPAHPLIQLALARHYLEDEAFVEPIRRDTLERIGKLPAVEQEAMRLRAGRFAKAAADGAP